jgi:hypothetical protein
MRAILVLAATALLVSCGGAGDSFDPSTLRLAGSWRATVPISAPDTIPGVRIPCTTSWIATFDTTIYSSPDTLYTMIPTSTVAICPDRAPQPYEFRGMSLFATQEADSVILKPWQNPFIRFASLRVRSSTRLQGPVAPYWFPRGDLILQR